MTTSKTVTTQATKATAAKKATAPKGEVKAKPVQAAAPVVAPAPKEATKQAAGKAKVLSAADVTKILDGSYGKYMQAFYTRAMKYHANAGHKAVWFKGRGVNEKSAKEAAATFAERASKGLTVGNAESWQRAFMGAMVAAKPSILG